MKLQYIAVLALATILSLSCEGDTNTPNDKENTDNTDNPGNDPNDKLDETDPASVVLSLIDIAQEQITFELRSENAEEVRWLCVAQSTALLDGETVMDRGTATDANTTVEVTADGLMAGMTYEIYAAASNSQGEISMASTLVVKTENAPTEDADYVFSGNIVASVYVLETNGLRNDYVSFYDSATDRTLYIDFYSPRDGAYLPTGRYPLGDGSSMTSDKQYTYITLYSYSDFINFTDGYAEVVATPDEVSGAIVHNVKAYYTMAGSGDTVSLQYTGTFTIKEDM